MVNTFLVDSDFRVSASKLDYRRLGKQRVEAYQILKILQNLRSLARYFRMADFPVGQEISREERKRWIQQIIQDFKKRKSVVMVRREDGSVIEIPKGPVLLPGDDVITSGFMSHPAVSMWLGFEEALKDYINAHIEEWIRRGYRNTMKMYSVVEKYPRPQWTFSKELHNRYRSNLLQKELERQEPMWYLQQEEFVDVWVNSTSHGQDLKRKIASLPDRQWFRYLNREEVLTLGKGCNFIWP